MIITIFQGLDKSISQYDFVQKVVAYKVLKDTRVTSTIETMSFSMLYLY